MDRHMEAASESTNRRRTKHGTRCRVTPLVWREGFRFALAFGRQRVHFDVLLKYELA